MLQNKIFIKRDVGQCLDVGHCLPKPVVLDGAEVWGCENCDIVNNLKLRFCKLGETPLHIY